MLLMRCLFNRASRGIPMHVREMISAHPDVRGNVTASLVSCVDECYACAQACLACADACLAEKNVDALKQCIRLNLDCADVCAATGALGSRRTGSNESILRQTLDLCAAACRVCGDECEKHASMMEHCRICADACRSCEQACREAMQAVH